MPKLRGCLFQQQKHGFLFLKLYICFYGKVARNYEFANLNHSLFNGAIQNNSMRAKIHHVFFASSLGCWKVEHPKLHSPGHMFVTFIFYFLFLFFGNPDMQHASNF